eukprot:gene22085-29149_t
MANPPGLPLVWVQHFPVHEFTADDDRAVLVRTFIAFFCTPLGEDLLRKGAKVYSQDQVVLPIDFELVAGGCESSLREALEAQASVAIDCLAIAAHEVLFKVQAAKTTAQLGLTRPGRVVIRLQNHNPSKMFIRQLKSNAIGHLATLRGTVIRMSAVRPLIQRLVFACGKCGEKTSVTFLDGKFAPPTKCPGESCRSRTFTPDRSSAECVDWQKVRIQEVVGADKMAEGKVPRTVEVEMCGDLVDSCVAGDIINVLGLVKVLATGDDLDALSMVNESRPAKTRAMGTDSLAHPPNMPQGFTPRDLDFVAKFTEGFSPRDLDFVAKFTEVCLGFEVWGLSGMCLGSELCLLFVVCGLRGVRKNVGSTSKVPLRGDIHVMVVGDPGLVSVVRDAISGEYVFEAGAVVLADRGSCCVDEFDKMPNEHQALLEAMEQQEVSVAKAGLVASLPSRTSIIAAANPCEGHYNKAKSVAENLKMSAAMLSRFDLIFILLDRPDEALDQCLSEHVMAMHSGLEWRAQAARNRLLQHHQPTQPPLLLPGSSQARGSEPQAVPLAQRLSMKPGEDNQPLPVQLLRKYIAYAKQYVQPRLSDGARDVLQEFYLKLRQQAAPGSSTPITARQLESLARLAEARAKVDLREEVTVQDAQMILETIVRIALEARLQRQAASSASYNAITIIIITVYTFLQVMEVIWEAIMRTALGARLQRKIIKAAEAGRFLTILRRHAERSGQTTFSTPELFSLANDAALKVKDIGAFLEGLNEAGELLKAGSGQYRVRGVKPSATPSTSAGGAGSQMGGGQFGGR